MLFRLIFWALVVFLAFRLIRNLIAPPRPRTKVKGTPGSKPLDLSDKDVEDANYREIRDD